MRKAARPERAQCHGEAGGSECVPEPALRHGASAMNEDQQKGTRMNKLISRTALSLLLAAGASACDKIKSPTPWSAPSASAPDAKGIPPKPQASAPQ